MIFRYPTLINRTAEILDEKLKILTSYEEIDERTAYGMIKEFPALRGHDASKTKKQLDVLKMEDLLEEIKALLFNLYRDYLADSETREKIIEYQRAENFELEKIKKEKYIYYIILSI